MLSHLRAAFNQFRPPKYVHVGGSSNKLVGFLTLATVNGQPCLSHWAACFRHSGTWNKRHHDSIYKSHMVLGKFTARNSGIEFHKSASIGATAHEGRPLHRRKKRDHSIPKIFRVYAPLVGYKEFCIHHWIQRVLHWQPVGPRRLGRPKHRWDSKLEMYCRYQRLGRWEDTAQDFEVWKQQLNGFLDFCSQ